MPTERLRTPEQTFCAVGPSNDYWFDRHSYSALCAECPVIALAERSLSVTANVRAKGCRALVIACDLFMKPSLSHRGVRTSEGVDLWPLRATSIALEVSAADVPDNRPLSLIAWTRNGPPPERRRVRAVPGRDYWAGR